MFSRLLSSVEHMEAIGILEKLEDYDAIGLFPTVSQACRIEHSMLGPTWVDDVCISVTADTAAGLETKASLATSILLETCMRHGVTPKARVNCFSHFEVKALETSN